MLQQYTYAFAHLNRNKLRGEVAPHKPVLLLALIDYIEEKNANNRREGRTQPAHTISTNSGEQIQMHMEQICPL